MRVFQSISSREIRGEFGRRPLWLSRLDAGRLALERKIISLPDLLEEVQRPVGRVADEHEVQLIVDQASGAAWGDPTRVVVALPVVPTQIRLQRDATSRST